MRSGYLGLGSNVGDSAGHLRAAIELLRERGVEVEAVSSAYVTEPVGEILDQPDFLNAAVRIRTELEPEALLEPPRRPHLLDPGHLGHVVVLDPGEVPDQPADGVGRRGRPVGHLLRAQPLEYAGHRLGHPVQRVLQQLVRDRHTPTLGAGADSRSSRHSFLHTRYGVGYKLEAELK